LKKDFFVGIICVVILIAAYSFLFSGSRINIANVKSMTINDTSYNINKDKRLIKDIVSMYNEAVLFTDNVGTTPSHTIIIELNSGRKIIIDGTTQGFHYVAEETKEYMISSSKLSNYLRDLLKNE
jgi:beta-lactam-binding protein with PASTA domain